MFLALPNYQLSGRFFFNFELLIPFAEEIASLPFSELFTLLAEQFTASYGVFQQCEAFCAKKSSTKHPLIKNYQNVHHNGNISENPKNALS